MATTQQGGYYLDANGDPQNAHGEPIDVDEDVSDVGDDVSFTTAKVELLASEHDLTAEDFENEEPSGKTGYTKADVESLIQENR